MGSLLLPPPQRWRALVYLLRTRHGCGSYPAPAGPALCSPGAVTDAATGPGRTLRSWSGSLRFVYLHDNLRVGTQTAGARCPNAIRDQSPASRRAGQLVSASAP